MDKKKPSISKVGRFQLALMNGNTNRQFSLGLIYPYYAILCIYVVLADTEVVFLLIKTFNSEYVVSHKSKSFQLLIPSYRYLQSTINRFVPKRCQITGVMGKASSS